MRHPKAPGRPSLRLRVSDDAGNTATAGRREHLEAGQDRLDVALIRRIAGSALCTVIVIAHVTSSACSTASPPWPDAAARFPAAASCTRSSRRAVRTGISLVCDVRGAESRSPARRAGRRTPLAARRRPRWLSSVTTAVGANPSLARPALRMVNRISSESIIVTRSHPSGCGIFITGSSSPWPGIVVSGASTDVQSDPSEAALPISAAATTRASSTIASARRGQHGRRGHQHDCHRTRRRHHGRQPISGRSAALRSRRASHRPWPRPR